MQILTEQTKQGASISGRRKASKEKAVIGKSDRLFLLRRKSGSGLTSAGLANGMYPLKQGLGEQNILWGDIASLG